MTSAELKELFRNGGYSYGTMVSVFDTPDISRILKNCGFDWFFYDSEHGYPNIDRLYAIFAYARMSGIVGLLRIPEINRTEIFRAMDMGVDGLVVPDVKNANQAKEIIRLAKYTPMGERGVSMTRPHTGFKKVSTEEYIAQTNKDTLIITQIESPEGVSNLDDILNVEGIDGVLIGPNDLSHSLGIPGQTKDPLFLDTVEKIFSICRKHNKFIGYPDKNLFSLNKWRDKGFHLLQWGSDVSLLSSAVTNGLNEAKN